MFDQLVVGAAPGDAITMCALGVKGVLDELAPTTLYSQHAERDMRRWFEPAAELGLRPNRRRPLIFHVSNGSGPLFQQIMEVEDEIILWYHNIAPADLIAPYSHEIASDLIRGRWELEQLRERTVFAIADSAFNAAELNDMGFRDVRVVPPVPDIGRLSSARPDRRILEKIDGWSLPNMRAELVLVVGQQLPHKRIERALAAAAVLQQEYLPHSVLAVTGVWRLERYSGPLWAFAEQCGLDRIEWLGRVSDEELASLFSRADVLLIPSEHEGFCVPAVEAMAAGVPVVASRRAALPETIGDAGIVLDEPDDPMEVAAMLHEAITNETLRKELIRRGRERAKRFDPDAVLASFMQIVEQDLRAFA
jgi:glycosyltransferase involved in cell wall biosynthesis